MDTLGENANRVKFIRIFYWNKFVYFKNFNYFYTIINNK